MAYILDLDLEPWNAACASADTFQESDCVYMLHTYNPDLRSMGTIRIGREGVGWHWQFLLFIFVYDMSPFSVSFLFSIFNLGEFVGLLVIEIDL